MGYRSKTTFVRTKEQLLSTAWNKDSLVFQGHSYQLFQDLSPFTIAKRSALDTHLQILQQHHITYKWGCSLFVSHTGAVTTPADLLMTFKQLSNNFSSYLQAHHLKAPAVNQPPAHLRRPRLLDKLVAMLIHTTVDATCPPAPQHLDLMDGLPSTSSGPHFSGFAACVMFWWLVWLL